MTTLAIGSSVTVAPRDNGTVAIATNGGFGSVTVTPTGGSASTTNFGPSPIRQVFGPYAEGAVVRITNSTCDSLDYDAGYASNPRLLAGFAALAEAALRPATQDVTMATPPTITVGVGNAASVIAGAVDVAWNDSRLTYSTEVVVAGGVSPDSTLCKPAYLDTAADGAAASMGGLYTSFSFATEATSFEVRAKGFTRHRIWVTEEDGIPRALTSQVMASTGQVYRVLYDFGGSRKVRHIVVQFTSNIGGISIGATESVIKWAPQSPRILGCGDSITEGSGATSGMFGYFPRLAEQLGCYATSICAGIGGTGYVATNSGAKKNALGIVRSLIASNPDTKVWLWAHGLNDSTDVSANAAECFDLVRAALPDCLQIVFGPFQPRSIATPVTRAQELAAVCATRPWLYFIDPTSNGGLPEVTGTGRTSATSGSGNSDWWTGSDGTHPTDDGHKHSAAYRAAAIRRALQLR